MRKGGWWLQVLAASQTPDQKTGKDWFKGTADAGRDGTRRARKGFWGTLHRGSIQLGGTMGHLVAKLRATKLRARQLTWQQGLAGGRRF